MIKDKNIYSLVKWILAALIAAGCSMSIPSTVIYDVYTPPNHKELSDSAVPNISQSRPGIIIMVQSSNYLSQPFIAYRSSQYMVETSKYSKWDVSPDKLLSEEFRYRLSKLRLFEKVRVAGHSIIGGNVSYYTLNIYLKRFERIDENPQGKDEAEKQAYAELDFDYEIIAPDASGTGRPIYSATFYRKNKLAKMNYLELARGLSLALDEGINEVSESLIRLVK